MAKRIKACDGLTWTTKDLESLLRLQLAGLLLSRLIDTNMSREDLSFRSGVTVDQIEQVIACQVDADMGLIARVLVPLGISPQIVGCPIVTKVVPKAKKICTVTDMDRDTYTRSNGHDAKVKAKKKRKDGGK